MLEMKIIIIGISISDINFSSLISEKILFQTTPSESLELLPPVYNERWPTKTRTKCLNCRKKYTSRPIPIPIRWGPEPEVKGAACHYVCAKSYIMYYKDPDIDQREIDKHINMLNLICEEMCIEYNNIFDYPHFYESPGYGIQN